MKEEKSTQILRTWKTTEKNKPENDRKNFESQEEHLWILRREEKFVFKCSNKIK